MDEFLPYQEEIQNFRDDSFIAVSNMQATAEQCYSIMNSLQDAFREWIHTIEISEKPIDHFQKLVLNYDKKHFLTFNSTKTLETLYNIPSSDICHIHGVSDESEEDDEKLLIGHGDDEKNIDRIIADDYFATENIMEFAQNDIPLYADHGHGTFEENLDIERELEKIHNLLRKDVEGALARNKLFFSNLQNVEKIYSWGFSYGKVDMPYIKKIIEVVDSKQVFWILHSFDDIERNHMNEERIKQYGFQGCFFRFG